MRPTAIFILITFVCLLSIRDMSAGVQEAWVDEYVEWGRGDDIAVDESGCVYVLGHTIVDEWYRYTLLKYTKGGELLWAALPENPLYDDDAFSRSIGLDGDGNIFVTGIVGDYEYTYTYCFFTLKFDSDGDEQWRAESAYSLGTVVNDMAVDTDGNACVTGGLREDYPYYDFQTVKYQPNGSPAWTEYYDGPTGEDDVGVDVETDEEGNVYVTGMSQWTDFDFLTIKYDPYGNVIWEERNFGLTDDKPAAMAVDDDGNVYVTGSYYGYTTGNNYLTIKYDPDGNKLWDDSFTSGGNDDDIPCALVLDAEGNVYVTGRSMDYESNWDWLTIKYDPNGNQEWLDYYDYEYDEDIPNDMAIDSEGNVYITGHRTPYGSTSDFVTLKYSANGDIEWSMDYDSSLHDDDSANAVTVDGKANVYVTGVGYESGIWQNTIPTVMYRQNPLIHRVPVRLR